MNAISLGPLVLSADRFAAILAIAAFFLASEVLARKVDTRFSAWAWWAFVAFVIGARLGHVALHAGSFMAEPWRVIAIWQGGFLLPAGIATAAIFTAIYLRRHLRLAFWTPLPAAIAAFVAVFITQLTAGVPPTPLPAGTYAALNGRMVVPAEFQGRPIVVNLWATWCPPCRREMPMMADVAASRNDAAFVFVNQGEGRAAVESYLAREGIRLETVLFDSLGEFSRHYAIPGLPGTLFIDSDGRLRSVHVGEISREALLAAIEKLQ